MERSVLRYIFLLAAIAVVCSKTSIQDHHKLLLLCFDGLKWSYHDLVKDMRGFSHFVANGVRAKYLKPPFPTYTNPAFMTLATGLYTESHGVVHNHYYDLQNNDTVYFNYLQTTTVNEWWDNGQEPIWITVEKQGLKSGGITYPGINLNYGGWVASKIVPDNGEYSSNEIHWREQVDVALKWLTEDNLDFVVLYEGQPDVLSHEYGAESHEILNEMLPQVDRTIQYLIEKIENMRLSDDLNIILASDHGMADVKASAQGDDAISIMKHLKPEWVDFQFALGPIALVEPHPQHKTTVYNTFKALSDDIDVYYKEDIPERFHYKNNPRIPSIVLVAHPGYAIYSYDSDRFVRGDHGYDNDLEDMRAVFYAVGPSFKKETVIDGFESVNVYPLMCYLLGLTPAPNNGSLDVFFPILVATEESFGNLIVWKWLVVACGIFLLVPMAFCELKRRKNKLHLH